MMGRVHRELQERFKWARRATDRIGPCESPCDDVLSALHSERANGRRGVRPAQREQRAAHRRRWACSSALLRTTAHAPLTSASQSGGRLVNCVGAQ